MEGKTYYYPIMVLEPYLDSFGHMNNAMYMTLFEEARWDLINQNGYGIETIAKTGLGPTLLEVKARFLKELKVRDKVMIESRLISYERKVGIIEQKMIRDKVECCVAEFTIGLFDIKARKLVSPTAEWLKAVGVV